jgi:hypothetical protein
LPSPASGTDGRIKATGQPLETYTIITTDPNELLEPIHNRMPVILSPQDYSRWLDPGEPSQLPIDLLRPYPAEEMRAWKVSAAVGNVKNNGPELRLPAGLSARRVFLPLWRSRHDLDYFPPPAFGQRFTGQRSWVH